jgi:tRNA(Ile)-lysidine synthase
MTLLAEVRRFWTGLGLPDAPVIVAVSGGPDSVALLRALAICHTGPLVIAHLNHQLRGADSDADETFVRELHESLRTVRRDSLDLCCAQIDVGARACAEHDNLENMARQIRYDWLTGIARDRQARWVATGHTADDQAETVLHRLLRGTGIKGLAGIPACRELAPDIEVVRPMLRVRRADVLSYLRSENQGYREDRSNLDVALTRNRIRHELLPELASQYNPSIVPTLCSLAEQAEEAFRTIEIRSRVLLEAAELPRLRNGLVFDRARLASISRNLLREVFRFAWEREGWPMGHMSFAEWDRAADVALGERPAVDLPDGLRIQCRDRVVVITRHVSCGS